MFDSAMSLDFESPELLHDFEIMKPPPSHSLLSFVRATMREIPSEIPSISALFQVQSVSHLRVYITADVAVPIATILKEIATKIEIRSGQIYVVYSKACCHNTLEKSHCI